MAVPSVDTITYYIQVEDINGCTDTASVQVFVSEQDTNVIIADIYGNLQNVITPNGDGNNDVLDLAGVTTVMHVSSQCILDGVHRLQPRSLQQRLGRNH